MSNRDLELLLKFLKDSYNKNKDAEDKLKYLYREVSSFTTEVPSIEKLEELKKIEVELETKYEDLYELGNYFDPVFIQAKKTINANNVFKMREVNKNKRG